MPSGRVFLLRKGDVLVMPSGTYHYVYTVRTKVAIAGDFISPIGWERRVASVARDFDMKFVKGKADGHVDLAELVERGLREVELPRVKRLKQAVHGGVVHGGAVHGGAVHGGGVHGGAEAAAGVKLGDHVVAVDEAVKAARADMRRLLAWVAKLEEESKEKGTSSFVEKPEVREALREVWAFAEGGDTPADCCPW